MDDNKTYTQLPVHDPVPVGEDQFSLWTLYDNTTVDFPGQYVARLFLSVRMDDGQIGTMATTATMRSTDVDEIRYSLMVQGRVRIARSPGDAPQIMESWL